MAVRDAAHGTPGRRGLPRAPRGLRRAGRSRRPPLDADALPGHAPRRDSRGGRGDARRASTRLIAYSTVMTTDPDAIKHLWTHKTQDHGWLADEDLVVDRAEGVWVWTENGTKLLVGFAGLAVVNAGHGRREIAEAIAEQTVRLAYYPTTRQFSNRPAAALAAKLATLTPGDLDYTMFAVSGSEANERAMQIARPYWTPRGHPATQKGY